LGNRWVLCLLIVLLAFSLPPISLQRPTDSNNSVRTCTILAYCDFVAILILLLTILPRARLAYNYQKTQALFIRSHNWQRNFGALHIHSIQKNSSQLSTHLHHRNHRIQIFKIACSEEPSRGWVEVLGCIVGIYEPCLLLFCDWKGEKVPACALFRNLSVHCFDWDDEEIENQ
jgi:hypothetical protein